MTVDVFIEKANLIHNSKYTYTESVYVSAKTKLNITCPIHGLFQATPDNHIRRKSGCPKCNGGVKGSRDAFVKTSMNRHENKYDYSLVVYKNNKTAVNIICPRHGLFQQTPSDHLYYGCFQCGRERIIIKKTDTLSKFIAKATTTHGKIFDYSKVIYQKSNIKVEIICSKHGSFLQTPFSHIRGSGCPRCKDSFGEKFIQNQLAVSEIKYIREKKFKDCCDIRALPFDFYLPEYNLCIEFDGIHHRKKSFFTDTDVTFDDRIRKDTIKTNYCTGINGYPTLLRVSNIDEFHIDNIKFLNKKAS
jgi:very-short-patch-repair endonuclease